jgi:thiamine-monophosphate kinase
LSIDRVGYKAIARSVSDVAAMAGRCVCGVVSVMLPRGVAYGEELAAAVHRHGAALGCPIVGGDLSICDGPLQLSVTVVGQPCGSGVVRRSGARVGDGVYVTGELGGSYASGWHAAFVPRVEEARRLVERVGVAGAGGEGGEGVTAMLDLSDGLAMDLGRLVEASRRQGVGGAVIEAAALPVRRGCGWEEAVGDGEDYELLFTATPGAAVPERVGGGPGTRVTRIGRVTGGGGVVIELSAVRVEPLAGRGWEHGR